MEPEDLAKEEDPCRASVEAWLGYHCFGIGTIVIAHNPFKLGSTNFAPVGEAGSWFPILLNMWGQQFLGVFLHDITACESRTPV